MAQQAQLDVILVRLAQSLGPLDGEAVALEGGITNRNFRARLGGVEYVVRLHGRDTGLLGIDRGAEAAAARAAAELGIAPQVVAAMPDCLVTRYVSCEPADARADAEELARALRRFHDSGLVVAPRFWVPQLLDAYAGVARSRGAALPDDYADAVAAAARIAAALPLGDARPCHDDLLPGNLIRARDDGRLQLVDWEYAGMGHPWFDLGNVAVNNDFGDREERVLLAAYLGREPSPAQHAALKLMRVMSDAREGAWGVVQAAVSDLEFDFDGYAREHFRRMGASVADARFDGWLALAAGDPGAGVARPAAGEHGASAA